MWTGKPQNADELETEVVEGITVYYAPDFAFPRDRLRIDLVKFLWIKELKVEGYY